VQTLGGQVPVTQVPSIRCSDCGKAIFDEQHATRHATQTGHVNFEEFIPKPGEVIEQEKPQPRLTEEEKQLQLEALQGLIKERKAAKAVQQEQEELQKEKQRRVDQKEFQAAKQKFKEEQDRRETEKKQREKMEAQQHLEELRKQIAEEKRQRELASTGQQTPAQPTPQPATAPQPTKVAKKPHEYDECTIQVRLTNGARLECKFKPTDTLSQLFDYVQKNRKDGSGPFSLVMSSPPRKTFTPDMGSTTLLEADLVPRALLILTKR